MTSLSYISGFPTSYIVIIQKKNKPLAIIAQWCSTVSLSNNDIHHDNFTGLGPTLSVGHKLLNLQYADNTLLFLKADSIMMKNLKWALRGYFWTSNKLCKV